MLCKRMEDWAALIRSNIPASSALVRQLDHHNDSERHQVVRDVNVFSTMSCQCARTSHAYHKRAFITCVFYAQFSSSSTRHWRYQQTIYSSRRVVASRLLQRSSRWFAGVDTSAVAETFTVRTVLNIKQREHITPALRELYWLAIAQRIQYELCLLMHKMFVVHAPKYITSLLTPASNMKHPFPVISMIIEQLRLCRSNSKTKDRWKGRFPLLHPVHRIDRWVQGWKKLGF